MNLFGRNFQRREQKLVRQFEIAVRVGRRHAAFVRPEKMDVRRRKRRGLRPARRSRRKIFARCARRKARHNAFCPRDWPLRFRPATRRRRRGPVRRRWRRKAVRNSPFEFILSPAARASCGRVARADRRRQSAPKCRRRKIRGSSAACLPSRRGWNPRSATRSPLRRGG